MSTSIQLDVEEARLAEIRSLDLEALRPKIERLTRLARTVAQIPIAYVSLVEADHVWQSSFEGQPGGLGIADRGASIASAIVTAGQTIYAEDARIVAASHPWVEGPPHIRFFCGAPIQLADGLCIGAFCIASPEPRPMDPAVVQLTEDLAAIMGDEIDRLRVRRYLAAAESEADAARRLLESFVQSAPVALAMTDRDLRFVQVSPRWCEEHGFSVEQIVGRSIGELFPLAYSRWEPFWKKVLSGDSLRRNKLQVPMPDGSFRWVRAEMTPWRDPAGEVGGLLIMTNEISDMILSLERAERSEQRLRLAVEIADLLVYEIDYRNRTLKIDGAADNFFPHTLTFEQVGRDIWKTVHPNDRPAAMALWARHLAEGVPFRSEYRMHRDDGREVWAFAAAELIRDADGEIERVVGVLKNITQRRRSEVTITASRDAAEAANRAKSEFLANMSHEIRTPLNGVMGVASALARTPLSAPQEEMVGLIGSSARALEAILSDVLDFSRIESGKIELKSEPFDLESCLRSAAALFEPGAVDKGLAFSFEVTRSARGGFEGDPVRIRQIVSNLLSNAVKFTNHGSVGLMASAVDEGEAARLTISVTDSGIGFDREFEARLFERFEQADGSITRRFGGSGLGLAISRSLTEAMGGSLSATSSPGRGSTFTLTLPLARAAVPAPAGGPSASAGDLGRAPRVLLAEDHAVNRRVVELILGSAGVDLTCVENGAEAVEAAASGRFDLILMDMQMPVMDGLTAIRAIRAGERGGGLGRTPIFGLSANALPEHVLATSAAGADGHLTKPISADALFAVVFEACARPDEGGQALSA